MTKKKRIGVLDIVIVVVVLVLAGGIYAATHKETVVETRLLRYQAELNNCPVGFSERIHVGDALTDSVKNYPMGKVVAVEAVPNTLLVTDAVNGSVKDSVVPEQEAVILTIEANVTETAADIAVEGSFSVKAGKEITVKGPGYAGKGYILTIER